MADQTEYYQKIKTQLAEKEIVNEKLYKEVAAETRFSPKEVEEMVGFVSKYTNKVIRTGAFDTVMIPFFGKFKPKVKLIQYLNNKQNNE